MRRDRTKSGWRSSRRRLRPRSEILAGRARGRRAHRPQPRAVHPIIRPELLKSVDVAVLNEIELSQATGAKLDAVQYATTASLPPATFCANAARASVIATPRRPRRHRRQRQRASIPFPLSRRRSSTRPAPAIVSWAHWPRVWRQARRRPQKPPRFASAAASCSVERLGAAPAMPTNQEVAARLAKASNPIHGRRTLQARRLSSRKPTPP